MRTIVALSLVGLAALPASAGRPFERRVYPFEITASSTLANDSERFRATDHPNYVADDDARTVWTEGATGSGAGEALHLQLGSYEPITRLRLRFRTGCLDFAASPRPRTATVRLEPTGVEKQISFRDEPGWQQFVIDQKEQEIERASVRIDSVYEGASSQDLCIADVQVFATSTSEDSPEQEKYKRERLEAWKARRAEAARVFAAGGRALPLLPSYRYEVGEGELRLDDQALDACHHGPDCYVGEVIRSAGQEQFFPARHAGALALARRALSGQGVHLTAVSLAPADRRRMPAIDGFVRQVFAERDDDDAFASEGLVLPVPGVLGALTSAGLGARPLASKVALADVLSNESGARGCDTRKGATYSWSVADPASPGLSAFVIARCGLISVRDGHDQVSDVQVLVYDASGRLEVVAGDQQVSVYEWADVDGRALIAGGRTFGSHGRGVVRASHRLDTPGLAHK